MRARRVFLLILLMYVFTLGLALPLAGPLAPDWLVVPPTPFPQYVFTVALLALPFAVVLAIVAPVILQGLYVGVGALISLGEDRDPGTRDLLTPKEVRRNVGYSLLLVAAVLAYGSVVAWGWMHLISERFLG